MVRKRKAYPITAITACLDAANVTDGRVFYRIPRGVVVLSEIIGAPGTTRTYGLYTRPGGYASGRQRSVECDRYGSIQDPEITAVSRPLTFGTLRACRGS